MKGTLPKLSLPMPLTSRLSKQWFAKDVLPPVSADHPNLEIGLDIGHPITNNPQIKLTFFPKDLEECQASGKPTEIVGTLETMTPTGFLFQKHKCHIEYPPEGGRLIMEIGEAITSASTIALPEPRRLGSPSSSPRASSDVSSSASSSSSASASSSSSSRVSSFRITPADTEIKKVLQDAPASPKGESRSSSFGSEREFKEMSLDPVTWNKEDSAFDSREEFPPSEDEREMMARFATEPLKHGDDCKCHDCVYAMKQKCVKTGTMSGDDKVDDYSLCATSSRSVYVSDKDDVVIVTDEVSADRYVATFCTELHAPLMAAAAITYNAANRVLMDSGAQRHIFINKSWFQPLKQSLFIQGFGEKSITHGTVAINVIVKGQARRLIIKNVHREGYEEDAGRL